MSSRWWAHPRSRGENICTPALRISGRGSSPLTRGKPVGPDCAGAAAGLIPAHAGKTRHRLTVVEQRRGSSPLTRGKPARNDCEGRRLRLIPAHAGKTGGIRAGAPTVGAHPRSRGENCERIIAWYLHWGSSPLTRGKRLDARPDGLDAGLIPAHAGKTSSRRCRLWRTSAHPRSRGENYGSELVSNAPQGSSPLTRGKRS